MGNKRFLMAVAMILASARFSAQTDCEVPMASDTMTLPQEHRVVSGDIWRTPTKKLGEIAIMKAGDRKLYLRMLVHENFYFNKVDILEIRSGSKSYYAKNTTQYRVNKTTGLFVIEIFSNYLNTLRDEGITSIVFNGAETDFSRQDAAQVRKMAKCVVDAVAAKKQ